MKQVLQLNKKWILTASLLAVLGTQYSYQSSSLDSKSTASINNSHGEFVLASIAGPNSKDKTEAMSITDCPDGSCKTIVLSTANYAKFADLFKVVAPATAAPAAAPVVAAAVTNPDSECDDYSPTETAKEKRDRIRCEKKEKKEAKDQAKKDKEKDKLEARLDKFQDKMEALKDKCADDIQCLSSGFTEVLSRFEGSSAIPAAVVTKAFGDFIAVPFKKALADGDADLLVKAQSLLQDMPDQYKSLKQAVILAVKAQATKSASKVSAEYATVNQLSKQNNPQAYFEALNTAKQDNYDFNTLVLGYSTSMEQSLSLANDESTIAFYQKSYVPDMQKIMSAVASGQPVIDSKNNSRTDRSGTAVTAANTASGTSSTALPENEKMTRTSTDKWLFPTTSQGVQIGNSSTTSRGGRGANQ